MPEAARAATMVARRARALADLVAWVSTLSASARPLNPGELVHYVGRGVTDGWRLEVAFSDRIRRLDLLIDGSFPHSPPRLALVDRPDFLVWPHLERDGVLCALPGLAEVSAWRPTDVAAHVLGEACGLIERCAAGQNEADLREEFLSYWSQATTEDAPAIFTLVDPSPPSRPVRVWRGKDFYLVAEDDAALQAWLDHRFHGVKSSAPTIESAAFLWFERPIIPSEYPRVAADLVDLARAYTDVGGEVLRNLAAATPDRIVSILAAPTSHGPCLAGVTVNAPPDERRPGGRGTNSLLRGYREGKVPPSVLLGRYLGGTPVHRSSVSRVDPAWVHGRGIDPRFPRLRAAKVAILGCGSLGAPIALKLAQAGIGHLLLVDPETLAAANVGRHPLGIDHIGEYKALALATAIGRCFPHIAWVEGRADPWQRLAAKSPESLSSCDLIISTIGHWGAEGALNAWHVAGGRRPAVIYGWTEAHAGAGHAVAIGRRGGCLQCGFGETGQPLLHLTDWSDGSTLAHEPACGAVFQPYGPIELTHIEALIAELALDSVLADVDVSRHRIWAARRETLAAAGGAWTAAWGAMETARLSGGCTEERVWPTSASCRECSSAAA